MSELAIRTRGLAKRFGAVQALRPLDLELETGSVLGVLGPNGAGKSTLLRLMAGLARPTAGELTIGQAGADRRTRRAQVGLVGHATFLYPALSARENLVLAGRLFRVTEPAARADALIADLELGAFADRPSGTLSRGLAQRVSIARALVHDPALLLLDEPFSGLDPRAAEGLSDRIAALKGRARSVVLVSHDLARAASLSERVLLLIRGNAQEMPPEDARDRVRLEAFYRAALETPA